MNEEIAPTLWLKQFQQGDKPAAQKLWDLYYHQLVALARRKLQGRARLVGDEEDVALSAFRSFCRGLDENNYPDVADRDEVWALLVTITMHKVMRLVRDETRQKRGGEWKRISSPEDQDDVLSKLVDGGADPQLAVQFAEQCEQLLDRLSSPELIELAALKLAGHTNSDIAQIWGKAERTVERKLQLIRQIWGAELPT